MGKYFSFQPTFAGQIQRITRTVVEVAGNVTVTAGRPAVLDVNGYWREPAASVATLSTVRGRFSSTVSNVGGANGAQRVEVDFYHEFQVIWLKNDTGTAVVKADRGNTCYFAGPITVTGSSTGNSVAGEVWDVTADGAYVGVKLEA